MELILFLVKCIAMSGAALGTFYLGLKLWERQEKRREPQNPLGFLEALAMSDVIPDKECFQLTLRQAPPMLPDGSVDVPAFNQMLDEVYEDFCDRRKPIVFDYVDIDGGYRELSVGRGPRPGVD